jgi:hypothetical protein
VGRRALHESAAPRLCASTWAQDAAETLGLATRPRNTRYLLALQFVEKDEALGADPRNHCKFKTVCALQILDSEDAGISQSSGTCERQSSALPCFGSAPVLLERGRFGPARQVPPVNRLECGFPSYSAYRSAFAIREILGLMTRARTNQDDPLEG